MIFFDRQQKLVMLCHCVGWSKVKLLVGQKLIRSIGSDGLMLKDMALLLRPILDHKNFGKIRCLKNLSSQCLVSITMTICVIFPRIMKPKGCSIAISVVHVLHRMARSTPTVHCTANRKRKKTNKRHGQHSSITA